MGPVQYQDLKTSEKFTLAQRIGPEGLEMSETMEMNGRRTFGWDRPILYRRREK